MERQDDGEEPLGGLNHHDRAQEPGSPPLAREHSGSLQQDEPAMMRRSDNYLPVPGEEKNLDVDRSSESIVCSMLNVPTDFKDYIKTSEGTSF